jgi:DNA-binding CsgD family transcriptional regulator/uncharacterized protein YaaQ
MVDDFAVEIAELTSRDEIAAYLHRLAKAYNFHFFFLGVLPTLDMIKLSEVAIIANMPDWLMASYDAAGVLSESPGFRRLRTTTTPFRLGLDDWSEDALAKVAPEQAQAIREHAARMAEIGLRDACYFPVHDADGGRAVFVMMTRNIDMPVELMTELHMIFLHVYNRLSAIGAIDREREVTLSDREVQCLTWTAAGKTSAEIAGILGLSEHTVNHYLNHVSKKLDAVNRTQAVVKALRRGLIS